MRYWRDKRGHEVDFIWACRGQPPLAIECKWSADGLDPAGLQAFSRQYPNAETMVVAQDVDRPYRRNYGNLVVEFLSLPDAVKRVTAAGRTAV